MAVKNHEFINSKGVFQGGGCKAVAFIGAYEAALENGVCFTEFAGTSAGSIFASLISAGASVDDMKSFIDNLNVSELILKAQSRKNLWNKIKLLGLKGLSKITIKLKPSLITAIFSTLNERGMCDAHVLEEVVEEELQKLLKVNRTVQFRDLKYPLTIVASDIKMHSVQVWNKKNTPNHSVAKAVSCSCAIPIYFKPVEGRYLDGGLLSNLPVSFFDTNSDSFSNILAFTLSYEENKSQEDNLQNYFADIISTITEGATNLQLSTLHNIFVVPVKTKMGLLDFSLLKTTTNQFKKSIQEGKRSFVSFLNSYQHILETKEPLLHSNQYMLKMATCSSFNNIEVICLLDSYKKIFKLFLTMVKLKNHSKKVSVYFQSQFHYGSTDQDYAVRLLKNIGVKVFLVNDTLPMLGYYFYRSNRWKGIVVEKFGKTYKAQYKNSDIDNKMFSAYINYLKEKYVDFEYASIDNIDIRKINPNIMIDKLKQVYQYKKSAITFQKINIQDLLFMHDFVYGYKYRAMDELLKLYEKAHLEYFVPAEFVLARSKTSIITPPIVEKNNESYVVISGLTRLFYAFKQGITSVTIAVVANCMTPTPAEGRYRIHDLKIKDGPLDSEDQAKRNYQNYRFIEQALRPTATSLL